MLFLSRRSIKRRWIGDEEGICSVHADQVTIIVRNTLSTPIS